MDKCKNCGCELTIMNGKFCYNCLEKRIETLKPEFNNMNVLFQEKFDKLMEELKELRKYLQEDQLEIIKLNRRIESLKQEVKQ